MKKKSDETLILMVNREKLELWKYIGLGLALIIIGLLTLQLTSACELEYGSPDADVKINVYSYDYSSVRAQNYLNFVRFTVSKTYPFTEWEIAYYSGLECELEASDVEIEITNMKKYNRKSLKAWAYSGFCNDDICYPSNIQIQKKNKRVLIHELGHAFGLRHNDVKRSYMHKKAHGRFFLPEEIKQMEEFIK